MRDARKENYIYLSGIICFAVVCVIFFFEKRMNAQNTTAYAMNYNYGFIPRGFIGTLISIAANITGKNPYTYNGAMIISAVATAVLFLLTIVLFACILSRTTEKNLGLIRAFIFFLSIFLFPEFLTWNNFGRLDEYLMIVTLVCMILVVIEKFEWMIIPLFLVAGLIHIGFVFTNAALVLVIIFYKAWKVPNRRTYYGLIFVGCLLIVSALFVYLEILRQPLAYEDYKKIVVLAKQMSEDGKSISDSLLDSEILGLDVFEDEWNWHLKNYVETPIFILLFLPYIVWGIRFAVGYIKSAESKMIEKLPEIAVVTGMVTILPELVLKVDYGRWMFNIIFYYVMMVIFLIMRDDQNAMGSLRSELSRIQEKHPLANFFLVYPLIFMPFRDVYISDVTTYLMNIVGSILHVW